MYRVDKINESPMAANSYVISKKKGKEIILIDPGEEDIKDHPIIRDKKIIAILLTHGHFDHIEGLNDLLGEKNIPVYIHENDRDMLKDPRKNMSAYFGESFYIDISPNLIKEGNLAIEDFVFEVYHTPGHTKGSVCYRIGSNLFTGDTLFHNSWGRTDLPGGNEEQLVASLAKLYRLKGRLTVYPGHGENTDIEQSIKFLNDNIFKYK